MKYQYIQRCEWAGSGEVEQAYHDSEWGVPVHDDRLLFEFLILEGAQAGLSWATILKKREEYRKAFDNFDAMKIAGYSDKKNQELLQNPGIIRNRLKVNAAVTNARAFLKIQEQYGSFDSYIWSFTGGKVLNNAWQDIKSIPVNTPESDAMSKDLKKKGFKFVGSTICYSYMQAVGMVNDHIIDCFRYAEIMRLSNIKA
ncbi:MAG: DNA-3-methyladenine glycosylase I [Desulfobulbaceae bacterium]|nr:DNA-3-methyladenine glycosylase I [Desulfobulbaceae bacterium]